ncbi:hypothetical protein B0H67DRAFT_147155 [Lasiosphaeris hirsuta]|uniref:Uncharacterized protein n=1 Tax=Lasiosphaeris hirsuta TaxID=260670 RepID=A0AA40B1Z6_9PEZI|nr:hypothetical protein B0H67DRAFT_147155 [Lasiosphaeris hirsuta]
MAWGMLCGVWRQHRRRARYSCRKRLACCWTLTGGWPQWRRWKFRGRPSWRSHRARLSMVRAGRASVGWWPTCSGGIRSRNRHLRPYLGED